MLSWSCLIVSFALWFFDAKTCFNIIKIFKHAQWGFSHIIPSLYWEHTQHTTEGPPKKAAVIAWMTFMMGTPITMTFAMWYTNVGSKLQ